METIPYFYIIKHTKSCKFYAGCRWVKGCKPEELLTENGYLTSSKVVNKIIQEEGINSFTIVRIKTFNTPQEAYDYETRFLKKVKAKTNDNFLNKHENDDRPPPYGSLEFKQLMLEKYGVEHNTHIPEVKEKQIKTVKEFYKNNPEFLKQRAKKILEIKIKNGTTGKGVKKPPRKPGNKCGKYKRTKEHIAKMKESRKGKGTGENNSMSKQENREKVSLSKVGRKRYYNHDKSEFKYCIPGTQPAGWVLASEFLVG